MGVDIRAFDDLTGVVRPIAGDGELTPVTATLLRALPLGRLIDENRSSFAPSAQWIALGTEQRKAVLAAAREAGVDLDRSGPREWMAAAPAGLLAEINEDQQVRPWVRDRPKGGRPPTYPPDHYRKVAVVYREAYARGEAPRQAVASHFDVAETTAAKWIVRARKLGALRRTSRGRAGEEQT